MLYVVTVFVVICLYIIVLKMNQKEDQQDDPLYVPPLPSRSAIRAIPLVGPTIQIEPEDEKLAEWTVDPEKLEYYDVMVDASLSQDIVHWCKQKDVYIFEQHGSIRVYTNLAHYTALQSLPGVQKVVRFICPRICT